MLLRSSCRQPSCVACGDSPSITAATLPQYDYGAFTGQPADDQGPPSLCILPTDQRWVTELHRKVQPSSEAFSGACPCSLHTAADPVPWLQHWQVLGYVNGTHAVATSLVVCSAAGRCVQLHPWAPPCRAAPAQTWLWTALSCCPACRVTPAELQRRLQAERPALVDVRPRPEFDMAHLPGDLELWLTSKRLRAARPGAASSSQR